METVTYRRQRVFDPLLRLLHWFNALAIVLLFATELGAEALDKGAVREAVWHGHVLLGYGLIAGLGLRLLWGLVGPQRARWSDFFHVSVWLRRQKADAGAFGHDAWASLAYLGLYAVLIGMGATGLVAAAGYFQLGPLADGGITRELAHSFKEVHELGANLVWAFIAVHIGALIWHERRGAPMAQSMVSGYQYRVADESQQAQSAA